MQCRCSLSDHMHVACMCRACANVSCDVHRPRMHRMHSAATRPHMATIRLSVSAGWPGAGAVHPRGDRGEDARCQHGAGGVVCDALSASAPDRPPDVPGRKRLWDRARACDCPPHPPPVHASSICTVELSPHLPHRPQDLPSLAARALTVAIIIPCHSHCRVCRGWWDTHDMKNSTKT